MKQLQCILCLLMILLWIAFVSLVNIAGGEVTHRIEKDADGNIILVPVNAEEPTE